MDKFKAVETFARVVSKGSLTAAAKVEGVVTAIVSRRIDALEGMLGVKLLVRTTRRVSLTHEGAAFLEDCQRWLADWAEIEANAAQGSLKATGHLRLTAPAGFGRRHVAPLVPEFQAAHPEVTVSLNLSDRLVDLAAEGYDCAIRVGDLPDSALVSMRLADNRRLCVAAPEYLKRKGVPQTPAELAMHHCLGLSSEASQSRGWAFLAVPIGAPGNQKGQEGKEGPLSRERETSREVIYVKPKGVLDCTDGQVLHDWCLAGYGIAWRSTWEVEADIAQGRLAQVLQNYAAPPNGIFAVVPARKHLPVRVRLWVDWLRSHYESPQFWGH